MSRRALAAIVVILSASVLLFIGTGPSLRRPTAWEEAAMSGASQANASQASLEGYQSVSVFDEARELGYGLAELKVSGTYYAVFTHGGSSLVITDRKNAAGDILLYDKIVDETDLTIGSFAFLAADYSDGRADSRSEYGKWSFSDLHKKELLEVLSGFASSGVPGFLCGTPDAEACLTDELRGLKAEYVFHIFGDLYGKSEKLGGRILVYLKNVCIMLFGKDEGMALVSGEPVQYHLEFIVFVNGG